MDIEIGELAEPSAGEATVEATEAAVEEAGDTGEWLVELAEKLDDRNLLEPLLFGPDNTPIAGESEPQTQSSTPDIDAEMIADIGKKVIDTMGDVKISQVVVYAEENPDEVNQLIERQLQEG